MHFLCFEKISIIELIHCTRNFDRPQPIFRFVCFTGMRILCEKLFQTLRQYIDYTTYTWNLYFSFVLPLYDCSFGQITVANKTS